MKNDSFRKDFGKIERENNSTFAGIRVMKYSRIWNFSLTMAEIYAYKIMF